MKGTIVVKIGGSTLGNHDTTLEDLVRLQQEGFRLVVVHGGGDRVSEWLARQGHFTSFVDGERVTDGSTLEMVAAVLAGLVNKQLVAQINSLGGRAVGLSGVDGILLEGEIRRPELGYVGEIARVNTALLDSLLEVGFIPVIAPLCSWSRAGKGEALFLNVNGDPVAGEIARALKAERLVFLTDVEGILDERGRRISSLTSEQVEELINSGVISGGMIPKARAAQRALEARCVVHIVDGRQPHALLAVAQNQSLGTQISSG